MVGVPGRVYTMVGVPGRVYTRQGPHEGVPGRVFTRVYQAPYHGGCTRLLTTVGVPGSLPRWVTR